MSSSAYEVLRVAADIDDEGLRRAYRVRLRETHPDTGGDAALFVQVQRAWELVGTPEARSAYDRVAGRRPGTGAARRRHPLPPVPPTRARVPARTASPAVGGVSATST